MTYKPNREVFRLHPKQFEVFQNQSRFRVVAAGRRFGKSVLARSSLIDRAARAPGSLNWYVCPSYRMSKQIMWDALIEAMPRKWVRDTHGTDLRITLVNNSKIELKGADNAESLRGVGLDFLVMDEMQDIVENVWTAVLRPTLMTTKGSALFIGTSKGFNYFHELFQKGMSKEYKNRFWQAWQFRSIDSPWITHAELAAMKEDMDPRTFRQEVMASFEEMAGRVYYPFDKNIHVGEYPFNPNLPILIGQDFNIDPMSSAIFQKQPNGEIWAIGEIVLKQSNVEEVCDEIEKRFYKYQKQVTIYPDPAGNQRQHGRGDTSLDIFRERGFRRIKYRKKHPRVDDRTNAVNKMLMNADGVVRMRVDKSCKHMIKALEQVVYKEGGREVDKSMGIEHIADALGYMIEFEFPARKIEIIGTSF